MHQLPEATPQHLPRWRGFNLLEKFVLPRNAPYVEADFAWIAELGFNFVRLPLSYRCFTEPGDWLKLKEPVLQEIDQAVEFGRRHGIHVNINFHRAPGYCVAQDPEPMDLWKDEPALEACAFHWAHFAKRYQGRPNREVSFNLLNEPNKITAATYLPVARRLIEAIRAEDPGRLIIADGLTCGDVPVPELIPFGIAQSTRGYQPREITHYQAPWLAGADKYPEPVWPMPMALHSRLYGEVKPELRGPLVIQLHCPKTTRFGIRIARVMQEAELIVRADGRVVLQRMFVPKAGPGEWKQSALNPSGIWAADYDLTCYAEIPAGTREIQVEVGKGDWLAFSALEWGDTVIRPTYHTWGFRQEAFVLQDTGQLKPVNERWLHSRETLRRQMIEPWKQLEAQGVGVHVGEWAAINKTPHAVVLAWMRDCLENWKAANWGWALWNFRGVWGVLDSERADVQYESWRGHKLDRAMLDLLQQY